MKYCTSHWRLGPFGSHSPCFPMRIGLWVRLSIGAIPTEAHLSSVRSVVVASFARRHLRPGLPLR